jgi:hypothetical protein
MEGFTHFSLVLGMAGHRAKFTSSVSELAFHAISTGTSLLEGSARLSLVKILSGGIIFV